MTSHHALRKRSRYGKMAAPSILLVALVLLTHASEASDVPQLKAMYNTKAQKADYIMVIDVSKSMAPFWSTVVSGIADFADSIPDGDHLSVILFEREATNSRILPRTIDAKARQDLRAELANCPPPKGLYTDFGLALEKVAQEVARPGANTLEFVFFFSDFVHEPSPTSPYRDLSGSGPAWSSLIEKCRLACQGKTIQSFALTLPLSGKVGRDVGLLRAALGQVQSVVVNQSTLKEWFNRRRAEIERDKLRALISRDLQDGWVTALKADKATDLFHIESQTQKMPLIATISQITSPGLATELLSGDTVNLAPGKEAGIPFLLVRPAPTSWFQRLVTTRSIVSSKVRIAANGRISLQPRSELATLMIEPDRAIALDNLLDARVLREGTPLWLQIFILAAATVVAVFSWKTWLRPAAPVSRSFRKVFLDGIAFHEELTIPLGNSKSVVVGNTADADVKSQLEGLTLAFVILSKRPLFPFLRPRRGLYCHSKKSDLAYVGKRWDKEERSWEDVDLPLTELPKDAVSASYRTTLAVLRNGERITITFARS